MYMPVLNIRAKPHHCSFPPHPDVAPASLDTWDMHVSLAGGSLKGHSPWAGRGHSRVRILVL
ncbi:hypothetical protein E2C01_034169 [Portunus trituberculatus]|uniref:Uncharacterized protein n=1 Tax=Portunus trituberculatus TaxID=210409 RepID=A0A5B7F513_PORTR|nr:hypothetical protein [Portunus trituberculatus]